jgi:GNAT superfamily N-acetyltransferase
MDAAEILGAFDAQTRANPPPEPGLVREWAGGVLRGVGAYNFIGWWELRPDDAAGAVAEQTAFFRARGEEVEWKVFSHDRPANLEAELARAGWEADEAETFLVFNLAAGDIAPVAAPGVKVRRATGMGGIEDYVAANEAAFGHRENHWLETLPPRLGDPSLEVYVAHADGAPVAAGRLEMIPGTAFAGLYGGGTAPQFRGRGVYRAMVAARAAEARGRGYRYLFVDARDTSRPILERLGFVALATIRGWMLRR